MKKLNDIIEKIGADKIMHFLVGMIIVAQFDRFGWEYGFLGQLVNFSLQFAKEKYVDDKADWEDTIAGFMGGVVELMISGTLYALM